MRILVLGLGNELLSDDGIGVFAARSLKELLNGEADVIESSLSGLALLEIFLDYEKAIIIDAVQTGHHPPGTIYELSPADLGSLVAPSPHYAGLPEMITLARELQLDFPEEIVILAVEVADPYTIGGELSTPVRQALAGLIQRTGEQLRYWQGFSYKTEWAEIAYSA